MKDENIIVDIVMCFDKKIEIDNWTMEEARWKNAYQFDKRRDAFRDYYYYYEDIKRVIVGYPDIDFRFIVTPSTNLPS